MVQMSLLLQDVHGVDIFIHLKFILVLQITSSLIITGFFEGLKLIQKHPKLTKKIRKKWKKWIYYFSEKRSCSKAKEDTEFPLTLFSQMTHSWWKVRKKYMSEKFFVLEDRTTLIWRRIDVMVGSPSKKLRRTWNLCGFLENCWWQAWISPIQHEQSSSQHYKFNQKHASSW